MTNKEIYDSLNNEQRIAFKEAIESIYRMGISKIEGTAIILDTMRKIKERKKI